MWKTATIALAALGVLGLARTAFAGGYSAEWYSIDCGTADVATGGTYALRATVGQADVGTLSGGTYELRGGFLVPAVAVPPANIEEVRSCLTHNSTEFCLVLVPEGVEGRNQGVKKLEFDVSHSVSSVQVGIACEDNAYGGTPSVSTENGGLKVVVNLSTALPNEDCCTVTLSGDAEGAIVLRTLQADADRNGNVNSADITVIQPYFGQAASSSNFAFDVDTSGFINSADKTYIQPRIGNSAACP